MSGNPRTKSVVANFVPAAIERIPSSKPRTCDPESPRRIFPRKKRSHDPVHIPARAKAIFKQVSNEAREVSERSHNDSAYSNWLLSANTFNGFINFIKDKYE